MVHSRSATVCHTSNIARGIHPHLVTLHQLQHTQQQRKA